MPENATHPGFYRTYPNLDHKVPGAGNALNNLVTTCTPCNEYKGNRWLPPLRKIERTGWDGLHNLYAEAARRHPNPTFRE